MYSTGSCIWPVSWGWWCYREVNELLELWASLKEECDWGCSQSLHTCPTSRSLFSCVWSWNAVSFYSCCLSWWTASPLQLFLTPLLITVFYHSSRGVIDTQQLLLTRPGHEQQHGLPHYRNKHERPEHPLSLYLLKIAYTLLGYITQVLKKRPSLGKPN